MAPATLLSVVVVLAVLDFAATTVYQTDDAVIIEIDAPSSREERSVNNEVVAVEEQRSGRQFGSGQWPPVLPIGPCFTSRGVLGRCTSFRQCYPYFKVPDLNNWETWVLGMYDTCSYFNSNGRQAFGVCCTNPTFPGGAGGAQRPTQPPRPTQPSAPVTPLPTEPVVVAPVEPEEKPIPNPSQGAIPPNWPPPLPTHPPNHTIPPLPTHPPSPGWPGFPQPAPTHPSFPPQPPTSSPAPTRPPRPLPTQPVYPTRPPTAPVTKPPQVAAPAPGPILIDGSCGTRNVDELRIVGGVDATPGEFPWIAALFNGGRQFCGGSLIDSTHILTAAHCIAHMTSWDVSRLTVRLGDHNIKSNTETKHVEKKVKRLVRHRGFDSRTLYNDIAILTLDSPVTFTNAIKSICLPSGNALYDGKVATVAGWGSLRESGPQPANLQKVQIPIWTNSECRTKYGNAAPGGIVEHFICAGKAGKDSCSGDSGGPLMVNDGRWTQVGVVSWGIGCGKGQYPGVYTRVTHFLPWIKKNL